MRASRRADVALSGGIMSVPSTLSSPSASRSEDLDLSAPLSEAERETNVRLAEALERQPHAEVLNARIRYGDKCGFAKSGQIAYLVNALKDRSIRVTVREHYKAGTQEGHTDFSKDVAPDGEVMINCTVSDSIPVTYWTYQIIRVQPR